MSTSESPNTATYFVDVIAERPHTLAIRIAVFRLDGDQQKGDVFGQTLIITLPIEMFDAYLFRPDPVTETSLNHNMIGFAKQRHVDESIRALVTSVVVFIAKERNWDVDRLVGSIQST